MKCPYCDSDMTAGYIQGARGVIFSEEEKIMFYVKNPFNKKDRKLADSLDCASPAFYCYECECLVWKKKYDEKEENAKTDDRS